MSIPKYSDLFLGSIDTRTLVVEAWNYSRLTPCDLFCEKNTSRGVIRRLVIYWVRVKPIQGTPILLLLFFSVGKNTRLTPCDLFLWISKYKWWLSRLAACDLFCGNYRLTPVRMKLFVTHREIQGLLWFIFGKNTRLTPCDLFLGKTRRLTGG